MSTQISVALILLIMLVAVSWLMYVGTYRQKVGVAVGVVCLSLFFVFWWRTTNPDDPAQNIIEKQEASLAAREEIAARPMDLPKVNHEKGFVSADACRECHSEQFETWHDTFHRTMTQAASSEAVVPSFDDVTISSRGRDYRLFRKGDEYWVNTVDPIAEVQAFIKGEDNSTAHVLPTVDRKIVMTTGSHYHQTYWMQNPNGTLVQFPWVYHIDSQRWVYRIDSFLRPPSDKVTFNFWNLSCIDCHATGGAPQVDPQTRTMFSQGELGISCEACHGPGEDHIAWARQTGETIAADAKMHIANPAKLNADESAQVCGRCHSLSELHNMQKWSVDGDPFHPGAPEKFDDVRTILKFVEDYESKNENFGTMLMTRFWPDGTVRTGGREYNGLLLSECHLSQNGDERMTCLSCHSPHQYSSPSKLISQKSPEEQMCVLCHQEETYTTNLEQHTHHAIDSAGSKCVNCHMPHTSYALFSAIRSHRIQSPHVFDEARGERPNACNLCHLDQTKGWAAQQLADWFGHEMPSLSNEAEVRAAGVLWGLKGDAAQRAVVAWHLGWEEAKEAAISGWQVPILAQLMMDEYSAVRYIAFESLVTWPGFENVHYDFDAELAERQNVVDNVLKQWKASNSGRKVVTSQLSEQVLIGEDGQLLQAVFDDLLKQIDQRPISIVE